MTLFARRVSGRTTSLSARGIVSGATSSLEGVLNRLLGSHLPPLTPRSLPRLRHARSSYII